MRLWKRGDIRNLGMRAYFPRGCNGKAVQGKAWMCQVWRSVSTCQMQEIVLLGLVSICWTNATECGTGAVLGHCHLLQRTEMTWKGRWGSGESWKTLCIMALEFAFISEDNVEFRVVFKQRNGAVRTKYRKKKIRSTKNRRGWVKERSDWVDM